MAETNLQHFVIEHENYTKLNTAIYNERSPNLATDPVFGAKKSLARPYAWCEDLEQAKKYNTRTFEREIDGVKKEGYWLLEHDFILAERQPIHDRKTHD
jgi:hypothetical protein